MAGSLRCRRRRPDAVLRRLLFLLTITACVASLSCSLDDNEFAIESIEVDVPLVESVVELPDGTEADRFELLDGIASDSEWGAVPYEYLAVNGEQGSGGGAFTVSFKSVRTSQRIYFLAQWPDFSRNDRGPRLIFEPETAIADFCDDQLISCHWRLTDDDEDRCVFLFDASSDAGSTPFAPDINRILSGPTLESGSGGGAIIDVWHWRAARTNPVNFQPFTNPRIRLGFADDEYSDGVGRIADPGPSFFRDNFRMVECGDGSMGPVPIRAAVALDGDGQPSTLLNDRLAICDYVAEEGSLEFNECTSQNPCRLFDQADVEVWVDGDDLAGYILGRPEQGSGLTVESRQEVWGRGRWENGIWTLELTRRLVNARGEDVQFTPTEGARYPMRIAVLDNSGSVSAGTAQVNLRF